MNEVDTTKLEAPNFAKNIALIGYDIRLTVANSVFGKEYILKSRDDVNLISTRSDMYKLYRVLGRYSIAVLKLNESFKFKNFTTGTEMEHRQWN